jgi:Mce-associated membrane protein
MSTTRHLINRQRRLAAAAPVTPVRVKPRVEEDTEPDDVPSEVDGRAPDAGEAKDAETGNAAETGDAAESGDVAKRRTRTWTRVPIALAVLTVLLGGFAAYAGTRASDLRDGSAASNVALSDVARTTEVKGQITEAVNSLFSYNYASTGVADRAVKTLLTGKAVQQHKDMLAEVRAQAAKQKLVLTTTVTESGVELIDGNRARVLLYADQSNTNTAAKTDQTTYAAAMFAVDAVRTGGSWRIENIDTFTR